MRIINIFIRALLYLLISYKMNRQKVGDKNESKQIAIHSVDAVELLLGPLRQQISENIHVAQEKSLKRRNNTGCILYERESSCSQ